MPDLWLDVDTALSEVPVNKVALIDDTDFKTREESVVYNQAGLDLVWNFVTTTGVYTQTAVTPTTAGVYDWTNQGNGMYSIEIPASGGASINNDTEGFGWFTGFATGILPWTGPIIGFRAAALNNALIDGGDLLDVNVTHVADTAQTANDNGADLNTLLARIVGTLAAGTHNPASAAQIAVLSDWIDAGRLDVILDAIKAVTDLLPDSGALSSLATAAAQTTAQNDLDTITGADGAVLASTQQSITWQPQVVTAGDAVANITLAGTGSADGLVWSRAGSGNLFGTNWAAALEAEVTDALTAYAPATEAKQDIIDANVDLVLADTNELQGDWADTGRLDTILDELTTQGDTNETKLDTLTTNVADVPTVAEFEVRTPTAAQLAYITRHAATALPVTFSGTGTTTSGTMATVDGVTPSAVNDQYNGRVLIFNAGTLDEVATDITDYDGTTKVVTVTAVPTAILSSHTAVMV